MELKSLRQATALQKYKGSNCTFMELKFPVIVLMLLLLRVLIVPLWN